MWKTLTIPAYYVLGHHEKVIEIGRKLVNTSLDDMYSNRAAVQLRFYLALSLLVTCLQKPTDERQPLIEEIILLKQSIKLGRLVVMTGTPLQ